MTGLSAPEEKPVLYDYWRSSASYRVRIALNLVGIDYDTIEVDLLADAHKASEHLTRNPQGLVPVLDIAGLRLTQSLAIIEFLHEANEGSHLLPTDAPGRARVRALAHAIAMDIHPLCNLGPVSFAIELAGGDEAVRPRWMKHFIGRGLAAFEALLDHPATGRFCHGDQPTLADICLVPQAYNARRWDVDVSDLARINAIVAECDRLDAFIRARPVGPSSGGLTGQPTVTAEEPSSPSGSRAR